MSDTTTARNRFGLGARAGERPRLGDPRGWLLEQLAGAPPGLLDPPPPAAEVSEAQVELVGAVRARDPERLRGAVRGVASLAAREVDALLSTRVATDRPFAERWVAFWSNHLCVSSAGKGRVAALAGAYEREAIRPHVFGPFEELLLSSSRHPAMLLYLDNAQSVGPGSLAARLGGRRRRAGAAPRGLNENYARELLELHTVGVGGGYDQSDVEHLARVLTGWTVEGAGGPLDRRGGPVRFRFVDALHEPGAKEVLGVRYAEAGEEEGIRTIRDLARRPETARFLSTKLARHFIDDAPPAAAIDRLTARWLETGGDLKSVARALVELDEAWDPAHRKFRAPQDWFVAILRAAGQRRGGPRMPLILRPLRQPVWAPPSPEGYGDLVGDWADPDSLMNRAELSRSVADRLDSAGVAGDPARLLDVVDVEPGDPLGSLLADRSISTTERLALGFASPAFQWR